MFHNRILSAYRQIALPRPGHALLGALILMAAMLIFNIRPAKAQDLVWVNSAGGSNSEYGYDIATDYDGNSYVTGTFYVSATFGEGANAITLPDSGTGSGYYLFIAKYDIDGTLVWAVSAGGATLSTGTGITLGRDGDLYVTGLFAGSATFGAGDNIVTVVSTNNTADIFVAAYSTDGKFLWVRAEGGTDSDGGQAVVVDSAGNGYVTGYYRETATFGESGNTVTLTSSSNGNMFIAKYTSGGELVWAKSADSDAGIFGYGVAIDSEDNPYVIGAFNDSATFGEGASAVTLNSDGGIDDKDLFIAKYASGGQLVWVDSAGGPSTDYGFDIALDSQNTLRITGSFSGNASFGHGSDAVILTSADNLDIFVARYSNKGEFIWAKAATGASSDRGHAVAVDGEGNSYITGSFKENVTFGQGGDAVTLTAAGSVGINAKTDLFLAKYGSDGELLWARRDGGVYDDEGNGVAVDSEGDGYIFGKFTSSATFGDSAAGVGQVGAAQVLDETITSAGSADVFVAKYGPENQPLAVTLGSFRAERHDETIDVRWQTVSEQGTAGFYLLALTQGKSVPLHDELIPSPAIDSVTPIDYHFSFNRSNFVEQALPDGVPPEAIAEFMQFLLREQGIDSSVVEHGPFELGDQYGIHAGTDNAVMPRVWMPIVTGP